MEDVARLARLTPKIVRQAAASGVLTGYRPRTGNGSRSLRWLFKPADVDVWLAS